MIRDILLYMNRNFVQKLKLPDVETMQYSQFKHQVVLNQQIKPRLITRLIQEIRNERNGQVIEKTQLRSAIELLIEVGVNSKRIYEQEFESKLLEETADYFHKESNQLIANSSCPAYLTHAHKRLNEEYDRVSNYLDPTTEAKLINTFLQEYIGQNHSIALIENPSSGLINMIKTDKSEEIHLLYSMFKRRPEDFELLRANLKQFIIDEGLKLV